MLQIIHNPVGQEHPYEQGGEERFPRQPLAGQPFTIGILTRPMGQADSVKVCFALDDTPPQSIAAQLIPDWQAKQEEGVGAEFLERIIRVEQDVWQAELTAPQLGQTLHYWIESGDQKTETFALKGENWITGTAHTTLTPLEVGVLDLEISLSTGENKPLPSDLPQINKIEWLTDGEQARRVRIAFSAQADEALYGLGERYNALNQRGEILDIRCFEQYKGQGKHTYMPMPFMLSSAGYGVWVQSSRWMQFDLSAQDQWILEADLPPNETLKLVWFTEADPFKIIGQFTQMTGPVALPPQWAFGLWMSGNEWNSQDRVLHEVAQTQAHDIPVSVLVIEAWSDETTFYIWNEATYSPISGDKSFKLADFTFQGKWHDPKGMVDYLHSLGIRVLLWQIPVFKAIEESHPQHEADKAHFEDQKFGVQESNGELYKVRPFWFRGGYLLDVTHSAALEWWLNKRAYLLDEIGIDGFKTDGGEHLWGEQTRFSDGRQGDEVWNEYPQLYTQAYSDFARQHRNDDALIFSRAGYIGSQKSPAHWAGDENSTWEAFRASILAGLSSGISGIPFWGWDLGGFSGEIPDAELYLRGAGMAAFCPIMQYHSEFNQHREPLRDRTPWNIQTRTQDGRVMPIFRHYVKVRQQLMPYIWQEAQYSASTGQPMMRALKLTHPEASDYQYFFGRDLLVCPVVEPNLSQQTIFLPPDDTWLDFWTCQPIPKTGHLQVSTPLEQIPVFVRKGAKIPDWC